MTVIKKTIWINIYRELIGACGSAHTSKEQADQFRGKGRIACIETTYEIGEGLDAIEQRNCKG